MKRLLQILFLFFMISSNQLMATHYMGGEITWQCLHNGNYKFVMKLYRECYGITFSNTETITVSNYPGLSSITMTLKPGANPNDGLDGLLDGRTDISPNCYNPSMEIHCSPTPSNFNIGSVEEWYYTSDIIYPNGVLLSGVPPAAGWVFSHNSCCRNPSTNLQSPTASSWFLRAVMYSYNNTNTFPCFDNSPAFAESPAPVLCIASTYNFSYNCQDIDNDSLTYSFTPALNGNLTTPMNYSNGYSFQSPLPGFSQNPLNIPATIDPFTGNVSFTSYTNGAFVTAVKVSEYRCGILIGEVVNELQIVLNSCYNSNPPLVIPPFYNSQTGLYSFTDTIFAGDTVDFDILASTNGTLPNGDPITLTFEAIGKDFGIGFTNPNAGCPDPPCATLNSPPPISGQAVITSHFNWATHCLSSSSGCGEKSKISNFKIKFYDNTCPIPKMTAATITLVIVKPVISPPQLTNSILHPNGDVTIFWIPPANPNGAFESYHVFYSNNINGPYVKIDSIFNYSLTTKTYSGLGPVTSPKFIFMTSRTTCKTLSSSTSDTLCSSEIDAGIIGIIAPGGQIYLGQNQTVKVILKNFGQNTLSSVPIKYYIQNSLIQVTEFWSGSLLHNEIDTFAFSQTFSLSATGAHGFCCNTILSTDMNNANDLFCKTINSYIQYDAGAIDIELPVMSLNSGDVKTVKIKFKNFGNDTLTSVNLKYAIDGILQTSEFWTGTLLPGDTASYTFANTFVVPSGTFKLSAFPEVLVFSNTSNDTISKSLYGLFTSTLPYFDNFDVNHNNFVCIPNESAKWVLGTPVHPTLNYTYDGPNAFYVKSQYVADTFSVCLYTQNFDFSNIVNAQLKFYRNYYIPNSANGVRIDYTTNGGISWNVLGTYNDPNAVFWYNLSSITSSGLAAWSNSTYNQYRQCIYNLNSLNNAGLVRFRFVFSCADHWTSNDIFAFDNFKLYVPNHFDAGVELISNPSGQPSVGTMVPVTVKIVNFGLDTLFSIPISYTINNNSPITEILNVAIPPDGTYILQFSNNMVVPANDFTLCAFTGLPNDQYTLNDTTCVFFPGNIGIEDKIHQGFSLSDNVPNPFSGKTLIEFYVPEIGDVSFKILNLLGQTLYSESKLAQQGKNEIVFDACNLENGIYFYSLEFSKQVITKQMLINH